MGRSFFFAARSSLKQLTANLRLLSNLSLRENRNSARLCTPL